MAETDPTQRGLVATEQTTCRNLEAHLEPVAMVRSWDEAPAYGTFASASPAQRQASLLARSRDHFQRQVKEEKHERIKQVKRDGRV